MPLTVQEKRDPEMAQNEIRHAIRALNSNETECEQHFKHGRHVLATGA